MFKLVIILPRLILTSVLISLLMFSCSARGESFIDYAKAFSYVESSNRVHVWGDNGKAYGLYQFHIARWMECGGKRSEFGNAPAWRQTQIFFTEINRCFDQYERKRLWENGITPTQALATYHNNGSIKGCETEYVRKIKNRLNR